MICRRPLRPDGSGRRGRLAFILVATIVATVAGCGVASWYAGLFTSDGRFEELDACTLLPAPEVLAPLVPHGAKEPGDSRPRTLLGLGTGGDARSVCKWSSVPAGRDDPYRTVRIHTETKVRSGRTSAETRAARALTHWNRNSLGRQPVDVGEQGYRHVDLTSVQIVLFRTEIYDVHVKFRISNALVDVSARTHTEPSDDEKALVLGLAEHIAGKLATPDKVDSRGSLRRSAAQAGISVRTRCRRVLSRRLGPLPDPESPARFA